MLFGVIILNENVGTLRIAGTLLIVLGCILIGKSSL
jgi:drug/metabolite transporter (DMT)-like permease